MLERLKIDWRRIQFTIETSRTILGCAQTGFFVCLAVLGCCFFLVSIQLNWIVEKGSNTYWTKRRKKTYEPKRDFSFLRSPSSIYIVYWNFTRIEWNGLKIEMWLLVLMEIGWNAWYDNGRILRTQMSIFSANVPFVPPTHRTISIVNNNVFRCTLGRWTTFVRASAAHSEAKPLKFDWVFIWQIKTYFIATHQMLRFQSVYLAQMRTRSFESVRWNGFWISWFIYFDL